MSDREKCKCFYLIPVYYGERPINTRGEPSSKGDWYFECNRTGDLLPRRENTIQDLCDGCKKYDYIKPLTEKEFRDKYYNCKKRQVLVVNTHSCHFKVV